MITVICPKHGEHEYAITSNVPGHEGAWCQICWLESMGPSLPYRQRSEPEGFKTMDEMGELPDIAWKMLDKNSPTE